jgi:hypothetical protein
MGLQGRSRLCSACEKSVQDLSEYTPEEVDALLKQPTGPSCMRATIRPDGEVVTKPSCSGKVVTAAVITPALSRFLEARPIAAQQGRGAIAGTVIWMVCESVSVTAAGPEGLRSTTTDAKGRYILDDLHPGIYQLTFSEDLSHTWSQRDVIVAAGELTVRDTTAFFHGLESASSDPIWGPAGSSSSPGSLPEPMVLMGAPMWPTTEAEPEPKQGAPVDRETKSPDVDFRPDKQTKSRTTF